MAIAERLALYRKLEVEERKRPLLVYVTNERPGVPSRIAGDVLPEIMDQLERLPGNTKELDFLVVSNGGDPTVAFRIMTLLRERVDHITVLIPQAAYSAATLLCLGPTRSSCIRMEIWGPLIRKSKFAQTRGPQSSRRWMSPHSCDSSRKRLD